MRNLKGELNEFYLRLALMEETRELANVYGVNVATVINKLKPTIVVSYFKTDRSVKRIAIKSTDTQSGIKIDYRVNYSLGYVTRD